MIPEKSKPTYKPANKHKEFVLFGIIIYGNIKKALINNPLKGERETKTLYVEEGDELDGYKVKNIKKDRIELDWHGEEIDVLLYSGIKNSEQPEGQISETKSQSRKGMKG